MVDIGRDQLEIVKYILSEFVPQYETRAFGSRVDGKAKKHSDLDIVIMTPKPLPAELMADMRNAFSESDLPFKVDIIDWSAIGKNFKKIILQGKVRVISRNAIKKSRGKRACR